MSSNFTGVTFAMQKITPSDDAAVYRAVLSDGILSGCELSYSGSTLTMSSGRLMICGRHIRHPVSQNWSIVDATSGFARLVLTVDLSRTSTTDVFDQVLDSIEYATSEDGFPELEQTDINYSGSRYQVAACVVSLGAGGITGIVSQLEICGGSKETGAGIVKLWESANTAGSFPAQTIPLDLSEFAMIIVFAKYSAGYSGEVSVIAEKGASSFLFAAISNNMYRSFSFNDNGVSFARGQFVSSYGNVSADDSRIIPCRIYGVKVDES